MKKLLSAFLCLCMMISLVPAYVSADEEEDAKMKALEMFGFPLDPDSYDTHALKKGIYPLSPKYDLYINSFGQIDKYVGEETKVKVGSIETRVNMIKPSGTWSSNDGSALYSAMTGFAATETGVKDHFAKVHFKSTINNLLGAMGGEIVLSIYDANGNALVKGHSTGGFVSTTDAIEMWEAEGLLSVTAGDFDGDGVDEIAVYTPNNNSETQDGSTHNLIYLGIFEFDKATNTVTTKQYIDLASKESSSEVCEWEYSYNGKNKQFYCIPYVALCAEDVNGDFVDDLFSILNFSTWFRGAGGKDTYNTKQIINHNTNFASVLEGYEGTEGGKLTQTIKHRVLVTNALTGGSSDQSAEHRYILRNANITVGDVTQEGSRDIIIAGNYTRASVQNITNNTTKVTSNRYAEVDGEHALCHIVGYTNYDNLKNHNTYDKNSEYHWTVQRTGNDWTYWYNEDDTDSAAVTTSLAAVKYNGTGTPDRIFVGGQFFDFDGEQNALVYTEDYTSTSLDDSSGSSVVWIGGAVAGNLTDDKFGREMLVFPFYYKVSGKNKFNCKIMTLSQISDNMTIGGGHKQSNMGFFAYGFEDSANHGLVSLAILDGGGRTSYITYPGNDTEVYYSKVEALAIMQAPPLYEELDDDDYIGNSATAYAKSSGSGSETTNGGSFTLGLIAGFEYKASFLGIIPCAGAEYEFCLSGSVTHEKSTAKTYTYTTGFETSGTTDAVTVFTVPYVKYNCSMYMPEYKLPTQANYSQICNFRDELKTNLENCLKTGEDQTIGTYVRGCSYYGLLYSSYVTSDNYQDQLGILKKVEDEIEYIELAIASFGKGGTGEWGGIVEGAVVPYHYSVPQTPLLTTVSVDTYDAIAEYTPGLEKIYGNVFDENYRAGDPNTYAHKISELKAVGEVLQSKQNIGSSTDGFLSNSNMAAPGTSQSQTIEVEEENSSSIGWGVGVENTSIATASVMKAGFSLALEHNTSYVTTNTKGQEYSGTVVAFPEGTPADYNYDWKLVSYNAKLNATKVPVVGYVTSITKTPPPSIAQNIDVENISANTATITWEDGGRAADYYRLSRIYVLNGKEYQATVKDNITGTNGKYSYTFDNLQAETTTNYILESFYNSGKGSVPTEKVIITTFPKGFSASIGVEGLENHIIYQNGKAFNLTANVAGNDGYDTFYQWQLDKGDGWEDLPGQINKNFKFTISPLDNGKRVRCSAVVIIGSDSSCILYSDPAVMNCTKTYGDYTVDWGEKDVTVTLEEGAKPVTVFVRSMSEDGSSYTYEHSEGDKVEVDLTKLKDEDGNVRLYIWDENLAPSTLTFEK